MKSRFFGGAPGGVAFNPWLVVLLGFLSPFHSQAASANLPGDWTTYGNNPGHTGYFPGTLNGLPFVMKWRTPMPNFNITQPAIGGGRVYVTSGWYYGNMYLIALDAETGQAIRTNNFGSWYSINPPTYSDGAVYVQRTDSMSGQISQMVRFDATTLATNWMTTFTSQGSYYYAPVVVNGTVYADTGYYVELTGYNRTNGAVRFSVPLIGNGCDEWTPAFYNDKVYTWVNGFFSEHNPNTGARLWTLTNATQSEFLYSMERTLAVADGRAYFTSKTKLMAVDLTGRTNLWEVTGSFSGTPSVANGIVYAISNSVVNAYTTNGVFVRRYDTASSVERLIGQLIVTDDVLLTAGSYGVYVFRLADGVRQQLISSFRTPCYCYYGSRISLANNTLYVSSGDGGVYAYSASNLLQFVISANPGTNGSPTPNPYGTNYVVGGYTVTNTLASPIPGPDGSTQYVVTGWTGTGSVPPSGNTNRVMFVATNDSTLIWNLKTQYFLDIGYMYNGTVDVADSWQDAGSNVTITATPAPYYHFDNWIGDASGTSNVTVVSMNGPRTVTATFAANVVTNGVPEWWLAQFNLPLTDASALADTDGDGFANWQEYLAGTHPKDAASAFLLTTTPSSWNPGQLGLRWPSTYNRTYRLWSSTNPSTGFIPLASNLYANPPYNYYYLNIQMTPRGFYRVEIE